MAEAGLSFEDEFEEVGSFLHENGILLHYDDISSLNDLYFIDPQWLCKMVSKIITIRLKNPYTNKGKPMNLCPTLIIASIFLAKSAQLYLLYIIAQDFSIMELRIKIAFACNRVYVDEGCNQNFRHIC